MLNKLFNKEPNIRFYFLTKEENRKRLTWDDLETIEGMADGSASAKGLKALAARFMVDENNKYLSHDAGLKVLGALSSDDIGAVLKKFAEAMQGAVAPKASGNGSNSPSEAGQPAPFPDGSQS